MTDRVDKDGRIQVTARLLPEEVRQLDAIKRVLDRETRSSVASHALKDWMRRQMANPDTAAAVAAILKTEAST